eukprot:gene12604-14573_t
MDNFLAQVESLNDGAPQALRMHRWIGDKKILGYITPNFAEQLGEYPEVFQFNAAASILGLCPRLEQGSMETRTDALAQVTQDLHKKKLIPGWRNELFSVSPTYSTAPYVLIERAATPYFGVKAYGIHVNSFVRDPVSKAITHMWAGRRASTKATFPGMLDDIVGGGLPYGIDILSNVVKECAEQASIPETLARTAQPAGAVTYNYADKFGNLKRDSLFCFDLELPRDFVPTPMDGEVESFELIDINSMLDKMLASKGGGFKPNCNLVKMDFFVRHGIIHPESPGYLELITSLRGNLL